MLPGQVDGELFTAAPGFEGGSPPLYDGGDPRGDARAQIISDTEAIEKTLETPAHPVQPGWHSWREANGVTLDGSGNGKILLPQKTLLRVDVEVEWITVSVGGASTAAQIQLYRGNVVDEALLVDFASTLVGSTPSRQRSQYDIPIRLHRDDQLLVAITGGVAGVVAVARAEGRARQQAGTVHV